MAHDISVLYGVPININDTDDTWKLVDDAGRRRFCEEYAAQRGKNY